MLGLRELGMIGIVFLVILVLLLPIILTLIVGIGFANLFGFSGLTWWAFVILFYIIVEAILTKISI